MEEQKFLQVKISFVVTGDNVVSECQLPYHSSNNDFMSDTKYYKGERLKLNKALDENSSLSYGTPLAIWDHTVLSATRHKWTRPALTPAGKLVLDLPTPEGWKAELI